MDWHKEQTWLVIEHHPCSSPEHCALMKSLCDLVLIACAEYQVHAVPNCQWTSSILSSFQRKSANKLKKKEKGGIWSSCSLAVESGGHWPAYTSSSIRFSYHWKRSIWHAKIFDEWRDYLHACLGVILREIVPVSQCAMSTCKECT